MSDQTPRERYRRAYLAVHSAYDGECEHGFGPPATLCTNAGCPDKELAEAWAAVEAETTVDDLTEMAWTIIANAGGGDWTKETPEWQEAAARWRERYFAALEDSDE